MVLALIPLMKGGGEDAIIQAWLHRAGAITDDRRRRELGDLAFLFSDAPGRQDVWGNALEGWNVIRSKVVDEWRAEAKAESLIGFLSARFGAVPEDLQAAIRAIEDLDRHDNLVRYAGLCTSLEHFRQVAGI